jgi:hypothetical protein
MSKLTPQVGLVLATTAQAALHAARLVAVTHTPPPADRPALLTAAAAAAAGSVYPLAGNPFLGGIPAGDLPGSVVIGTSEWMTE